MEWIILIILALVFVWAVWTYNRMVRMKNQVNEAWAGIDVQLQKRYELVPNLVETVKGYMRHESGVLERVTRLRNESSLPVEDRSRQESGLSRSIGRLFALAEDYPDLKASEGFQQLHSSLVEIEDHLQFARRYYNGSVRDYNTMTETVPSNLVAGVFRFEPREFFQKTSDDPANVPLVKPGSVE